MYIRFISNFECQLFKEKCWACNERSDAKTVTKYWLLFMFASCSLNNSGLSLSSGNLSKSPHHTQTATLISGYLTVSSFTPRDQSSVHEDSFITSPAEEQTFYYVA